MSDLVVAGVQSRQFWEDKCKNLEHFENLLERSDLSDVDVLLFPEMFHTGFTMNAKPLAETMSQSEGVDWLKTVSARYKCLTIASLIIEEDGLFYNRMVAVFPNGQLEKYDKMHLFSLAGEEKVFSPGMTEKILEFKGWRIKLQVCFDLRFPEGARNGIGKDGKPLYDLLVYNANWPTRRIKHWDILVPARAVENQCYVLAVNRIGTDGNGIEYDGHSQLVDAQGEVLQKYENSEEIVFTSVLSRTGLESLREKLAFLKDRKENVRIF